MQTLELILGHEQIPIHRLDCGNSDSFKETIQCPAGDDQSGLLDVTGQDAHQVAILRYGAGGVCRGRVSDSTLVDQVGECITQLLVRWFVNQVGEDGQWFAYV